MGDELTELAKAALTAWIVEHKKIAPPSPLPESLKAKAGVFVSLHIGDDLRGCIGTFKPTTENIAWEIIEMAIEASTQDPRFPPVRASEILKLDISVDVLGEPEQIDSMDMLDPKVYGVIVSSGYKRGLLLPDLEGVDTVEQQVSIAKRKAGIYGSEQVKLQRFKVTRHH
jgi:AmmeMemoRadiSam system protein A